MNTSKIGCGWSECRWFICLAHHGQGRTWHVCLKASLAFRVSPNSCRECSFKLFCMVDLEIFVSNHQLWGTHQGQGWTRHTSESVLCFPGFPQLCHERCLKLICMIDCELVVKNQQHYLDKVGHAMCLKALTCFPGFPQLLPQTGAHSSSTCVWSWNLRQNSSTMLNSWSTRLDMKCVWKL